MRRNRVILLCAVLTIGLLSRDTQAGPINGMLQSLTSNIGGIAKSGAEKTKEFGKDVAGKAAGELKKLGEVAGQKAQEVIGKVGNEVSKAGDTAKTVFHGAVDELTKGEQEAEKLISKLKGLDLDKFKDLFKFFSSTSEVPLPRPPNPPSPQPVPPENPTTAPTPAPQPEHTPLGGDFSAIGGSVQQSLMKLADEQVRSQLVKGFLSSGEFLKNKPSCVQLATDIGQTITYFSGAVVAAGDSLQGVSMLSQLNNLVKLDRLARKLFSPEVSQDCLGSETSSLKKVLVKLVYFNEEFMENAKMNFMLLGSLATTAMQFQMGAYSAAGEGLTQVVKAASETSVSVDEATLAKIDLWSCTMAVMKARSRQNTQYDTPVKGWKVAMVEARPFCLSTGSL